MSTAGSLSRRQAFLLPPLALSLCGASGLASGHDGVTATIRAQALAHLRAIHANRALGRAGDNAYWILDFDDAYVQAIAPWDSDTVWLEARESRRAPIRSPLWQALGFNSPGPGPNPNLEAQIEDEGDLQRMAEIGARALVLIAAPLSVDSLVSTLKLPSRPVQKTRLALDWI